MGTKTALITGITGQDGAILAQILLEKGYIVHGLRPYLPVKDTDRLSNIENNVILHYGDLGDGVSLIRTLQEVQPDEIYNLAAMSHVHASFAMPEMTANINGIGTLRLLEAIRTLDLHTCARLYQASSSEMFGNAPAPQDENTPFEPCSPYGVAKLYAYWMVRSYRDAYGFHASNGILFNHESPVRGEEFVTRKITCAIGEIEAGIRDCLILGNLDAVRDWGHAHDYMMGAWMMLQQDKPDDYVLATGAPRKVRSFVEQAFACIGQDIVWHGKGLEEEGRDRFTGKTLVKIDPQLYRPVDIHYLAGNPTKAKTKLGWAPAISFETMVAEMVESDRLPSRLKKIYG